MDRRRFIGVVGTGAAISLSGCSTEELLGSDDEANTQDSQDQDEPTETIIEDSRNIQEDEWYYWEYSTQTEADYTAQMTVRDGPNVDFIVTDQNEFQHLRTEIDSGIIKT